MAGTVRGIGSTGVGGGAAEGLRAGRPGGTGLRVVACPPRPDGEARWAGRPTGLRAGTPPTRHDAIRPGGRPVQRRLVQRRPVPGRPVGGRAAVAVPSSSGAGPVRLTRRGRWALAALALGVAALAVLALSAVLGGGDQLELAGGSSVVVERGDTVWSIAAEVARPGEDVRAVVDAIEHLNDLEGSVVVPGQVLEVP